MDSPEIRQLVADAPNYARTDVHTDYYRPFDPLDEAFWTYSVPSYGCDATVNASSSLPDEIVHDVTGYVFRDLYELRADHPFFNHLDYQEMRDELMAPLHPGAEGEWTPVGPWWVF